ncbi:hypothetical protein [Saccharospirillum salsuginis]|uniref:Uncharacterized protein n=1 Tax=Saccharospirillum salsuginis TaxID=418750 RepID=A0A918KHP8_9GAMM|nr:hypothetical protein [Saccharospirillum salsuginis]GGX64313.1 hypothetical protein GCM10007392_35050 [Saccharospirillum salsuginis]
MSQNDDPKSLLKDLEDIRQSLDRIVDSESAIPLLDEIVDKRTPTHVNPDNPFLSSQSLSELIRIRNEAEARAAEEIASLAPLRPIEDIIERQKREKKELEAEEQQQLDLGDPEPEPEPELPKGPDPELILEQLETAFSHWIDDAVASYVQLFENDIRNRLQQDFRKLIWNWYEEHELPIPEGFLARERDEGPKTFGEHRARKQRNDGSESS